jgi:hypothetical protein
MLDEIKDQMDALRKITKNFSKSGYKYLSAGTLKRNKFIQESFRKHTKSFKENEIDLRSGSSVRSMSIGAGGTTETI